VDAVIDVWLVLRRLLFYRPLIFVLLLFVYSVAALLLFTVDSPGKGLAVAAIAAFATGGLSAVLTERITRYSLQASALGLPDHSRMMRRAQGCFLALFIAPPVALTYFLGGNPLAALAALAAATAAGILLVIYGPIWIVLVPVLGRVLPLARWAEQLPIQALATAVCGYVIWRWFDLPLKVERAGRSAPSPLADAGHERVGQARKPDVSDPVDKPDVNLRKEMLFTSLATNLEAGQQLPSILGLGLGYTVQTSWRSVLYGVGASIAILAAWHVFHGYRPAALAYVAVTALCCFSMVRRLQGLVQRWMRTSSEQALLRLASRWPDARSIKRAFLASTVMIQRGSVTVWVGSCTVAVSLGWIDRTEVVAGVLAVIATFLAFSGAAWAVFAQRRVREWHLSTIALVLLVGAGAVTLFFGALPYGVSMMLIPPALALIWYALAPLRVPLNVDPRALRATV
jgi:hypothetical protein